VTNFAFLRSDEWRDLHAAASKAEGYTLSDPRTALVYGRRTVELIVEWLYAFDPAFRRPYDDGLSALMADASFKDAVPTDVRDKMHALRKLGNAAVHDRRVPGTDQSLVMVRELFHVCYWFARTYTQGDPNAVPGAFSEALLPPPPREVIRRSQAQLRELDETLKARDAELRAERKANAALRAQIEALRPAVSARRVVNEAIPDRHDYSEAETRELLIDLLLREAGWDPAGENVREYRVQPMPNPQGYGFADYVLWGDDGLPLAVVEAKRTSVDREKGRQQARLYADALEQMHGRRPIIFYTNGYEISLWDDAAYPTRDVRGFYTRDELERLIQRRTMATDPAAVAIDPLVVDRAYQHEAIRRAAEHFAARHRRALLVMATGTGKTRVAVALVDVLMRAGWVKRVLFLADRKELVRQAVGAFKSHLPSSNPINLLEDKEAEDSRVVVSTYHTMLNLIDQDEGGRRRFTPGHFDLVIIDEAHRSVYQKFGAIFDYFDGLLLGLTATPRDEVDRNTYRLFDLEQGVPTFSYELNDAVAGGYLVPPLALETGTTFLREGIHYDDLSEEEQEEWDRIDWNDSGEIPEEIDPGALNAWLFNTDTADHVLRTLMERGLKVAGGDRLGKTIIFARNHRHAEFIRERFDHHYPHLAGSFAQVIDHTIKYADTLIDKFKLPDAEPHIAISVDMLDTGIDVPEVVNLVFFKPVRSRIKFWQMIGRGTRLRPDLFGPGRDKEQFLLFDFCGNLEYFRYNPAGVNESRQPAPLRQRLFEARLALLLALQVKHDPLDEPLRGRLADSLHAYVAAMNLDNFIVRPARRYVEPFQERGRWEHVGKSDAADLRQHVAGLPSQLPDDLEPAKQFDLLVLNLQLAQIEGEGRKAAGLRNRIVEAAGVLQGINIPMVQARRETLERVQTDEFWAEATLPALEDLRSELRDIMHFIERDPRRVIETDFDDQLGETRETYLPEVIDGVNRAQYRKKVEQFIRERQDEGVIRKIRLAQPLTARDLADLEGLFNDGVVEPRELFVQIYGAPANLAAFIRSLVGLDRKAAKERFAAFLDNTTYTADQIQFVNTIIDYLTRNGTMDPGLLYDQPFTAMHYLGVEGMFAEPQARELVAVIRGVNESVLPVSMSLV
jgi:type I restriction enzyme R subunit